MARVFPQVAITALTLSIVIGIAALTGCSAIQQKFLFYPSHRNEDNGLAHWQVDGRLIGYARIVDAPKNIWLLLHGNGGQASDRSYALPSFSPEDSVFILEYPGYGMRSGSPSRESFDAAAIEAYLNLRKHFPSNPICAAGESIGSGPACVLAQQPVPPDKIVLVVPFDNLKSVASEHMPYLPVGFILGSSWNNAAALAGYQGPVEIFGAEEDTTIPYRHAEALAQSVRQAQFHKITGGHNDWSRQHRVSIHNP